MEQNKDVEEVIIDNTTTEEAKPKTLEVLIEEEKDKLTIAKRFATLEQENQELKEAYNKIINDFEEFKKANKKITINDTSALNTNKTLVEEVSDPVARWNNLYKKTKIN